MTEQSAEQTSTEANAEQPQEGGGEQEPKTFDADYVANLRKEAARYRTDAKAATAELEKQRQASMSEAEKAVAEAEARGRTSAATEYGKRLAVSEIKAAAATAGANIAGVFDYLDMSRFVTDDGEPNAKEIAAFVASQPRSEATPPSYDGGARQSTKPVDFNQELRRAAGRE